MFGWYHSFDPHGPVSRHLNDSDLHPELEREPGLLQHFPRYQQIEDITEPALFEALYARGVAFADEQVARVVSAIKASGRYDDALIIFFADHGEGFRERALWYDHGAYPHAGRPDSAAREALRGVRRDDRRPAGELDGCYPPCGDQ